MAKFKYKVLDANNKKRGGTMESANLEAAKSRLVEEGCTILSLSESKSLDDASWNIQFGSGVSIKEMSVFCRQFYSLMEAGVTVVNALNLLIQQSENKDLKKSLRNVQNSVEKGETLANSMRLESRVFPELLVNMVAAGEATGNLDKAFLRITQQFEKDNKLRSMIRGAMIYPIVIMVVAVVVVIILLVMVVPNFESMLSELDTELPAITKIVVGASKGMQANAIPIVLMVTLVAIGFVVFKRSRTGKLVFSQLGLKLPMFKDLTIKSSSAKLSRTLSTLLQSGVSLPESVDIVADTLSNQVVKKALKEAKEEIMRGVPLSEPLERCGLFPPMVYHMIRIGEETGTTENMLDKIADYYEDEVEAATKALTTMMEPAMILLLAIIVGSVVMSIVMPMMTMYQALDKETQV